MKRFRILICMATLITFNCQAEEKVDNHHLNDEVRILKLLPPSPIALAVNPAIPEHYVAMTPDNKSNIYEWTYWGPREVLEAFFKDPKSLNQPIFRVKLSQNALQKDMKKGRIKQEDMDKFLTTLKATNFQDAEHKWGDYPVYTMKVETPNGTLLLGWVGLNMQEDWTLAFEMIYPESRLHPSQEDLDVWTHFLTNTQQLPEPLFLKAHGLDMQPGSTLVDMNGTQVHFIAEKRKRDNLLQVVIVPLTSDVSVHYATVSTGFMGSKWMQGEPLVKIGTHFRIHNEKWNVAHEQPVSVLIKPVDEFSISAEENGFQSIQIYQ